MLSTLCFAALLSLAESRDIYPVIRFELTLAGLLTLMGCLCFWLMPDFGDEQIEAGRDVPASPLSRTACRDCLHEIAEPSRDRRFRYYLGIFFVFACGTLSYAAIVPAYFALDLNFGYVQATLFLHVIPSVAAFLFGGRFAASFDSMSIWRSFSMVTLLWGLDPVLIALAPTLPILFIARTFRGPATVGSMVLSSFTGVLAFSSSEASTSRHASFQFLVNGVARLLAPLVAAALSLHVGRFVILLYGGTLVLRASASYYLVEKRTTADAPPELIDNQRGAT